MTYTKEPWPEYIDVAVVMTPDPNGPDAAVLSFEDYKRARACVNACAGITSADLERVKGDPTPIFDLLMQTTKQRDDLLALITEVLPLVDHHGDARVSDRMHAAIANAEQKP